MALLPQRQKAASVKAPKSIELPMPTPTLEQVCGGAIEPYLADLARLRIEVFRHWPYLYEGTLDYEMQYLTTYVQSPRSICVLVLDAGRVVGASTGLPLSDETAQFQAPFIKAGWDISRLFYFGESVLLSAYRSRGLGHEFFNYRQRHAQSFGCFDYTTFAAVDRPANHPMRPAGHRDNDEFWHKRGYRRRPELTMQLSWPEIGSDSSSEKNLTFWLRPEQPQV